MVLLEGLCIYFLFDVGAIFRFDSLFLCSARHALLSFFSVIFLACAIVALGVYFVSGFL